MLSMRPSKRSKTEAQGSKSDTAPGKNQPVVDETEKSLMQAVGKKRVLNLDEDTQQMVNNAVTYMQFKDFKRALGYLNDAIMRLSGATVDPKAIPLLEFKIDLLARLGNMPGVVGTCDTLKSLDWQNLKAWNMQGMAMLTQHRPEYAKENFLHVIELLDAGNAEAWIGLGEVATEEGQLEEAIERLDKAISLNPSLIAPWFDKGYIYAVKLGQAREAIECFDQVLAIDPTNARTLQAKQQVIDAAKEK